MNATLKEIIFHWLDPIGIVIGIILAVPVFWTWWELTIGKKRKNRVWHHNTSSNTATRPAILVIDLLINSDINQTVKHFLKTKPDLNKATSDRFFLISKNTKFRKSDMPWLIEEIEKAAFRAATSGTNENHLFFGGPAVLATIVGEIFANRCTIKVYHRDNEIEDEYICLGPTHLPK